MLNNFGAFLPLFNCPGNLKQKYWRRKYIRHKLHVIFHYNVSSKHFSPDKHLEIYIRDVSREARRS
jgi:hypothetical protein